MIGPIENEKVNLQCVTIEVEGAAQRKSWCPWKQANIDVKGYTKNQAVKNNPMLSNVNAKCG